MALTTSTETVAGPEPITVMSLEGELDASNFERFIDEVRALYLTGTRRLLLDMTGLTFLASSGLVALHSIVLVMRGEEPTNPDSGWDAFHALGREVESGSAQRDVQLAGPPPAVQRVLDRTGLNRLFIVHPDRATGIAGF
jgi:anti-anti-sigma factor